MALLYSTGPVQIWVGIGTSRAPLYLGTAEVSPVIDTTPYKSPVFNDLAGERPFEYLFHGEEASIQFVLTRWKEATYTGLRARPYPFPGGQNTGLYPYESAPGSWNRFSQGSMYLTQGMTFQTWLYFPYNVVSPWVTTGTDKMIPGYQFFNCFVEADQTPQMGTRGRKIMLGLKAIPVYTPINTNGTFNNPGGFDLYSNDVSQVSGLNTD